MMRRLIPLVVWVVLFVSACGSNNGASDEAPASSTTTASVTPTATTAAVASTTSTAVATTTSLPDRWRYANDDHGYAYQSLGYSCEADASTGCEGDKDMSLVQIWLHKDGKDRGGESNSADCLEIMMKPQPGSSYDFMDMLGSIDDQIFVDTGWGIRIVQLDSPPTGLEIGGRAWLELTVSSLSATEFTALLPRTPRLNFIKYFAPTNGDPVLIEAVPDTTNFIEELVLVETTNDMMQWIIVLNEDETFRHTAGYWGGSGGGWTNGLFVKIGR